MQNKTHGNNSFHAAPASLLSNSHQSSVQATNLNGNLNLLSQISVDIRDNFVPNLKTDSQCYDSDLKLDFLCNLDLIPSVLIENAPNATKKWLRAEANMYTESKTGINAAYDEEHYQDKVNFMSVARKEQNIYPEKISKSMEVDKMPTTSPLLKNTPYDVIFGSEIPTTCTSLISPTVTNFDITFGVDHSSSSFTKLNEQNKHSRNVDKTEISYKFDEKLPPNPAVVSHPIRIMQSELQELVSNELNELGVNQTVFAKASIGKTQGYLSSLLKNSGNFTSNNKKACQTIGKIIDFLQQPLHIRQTAYDYSKNLLVSNVNEKVVKKQSRTYLDTSVKENLATYFQEKHGKISRDDLHLLSAQLNLPVETIRIFYKNMKQRKKVEK